MVHLLIDWLILSVAVWLTAVILPGVHVRSFGAAIVIAAIFGVLNFFVGKLLFLAIGVLTLGVGFLLAFLTRWLVNALMLRLTDALSSALTIRTWGMTFIAALLMSGLGTLGQWLVQRFM